MIQVKAFALVRLGEKSCNKKALGDTACIAAFKHSSVQPAQTWA